MTTQRDRAVNVFLVGAGPGDADLLTRRAARLLAEAEVILYDRLVSDEVLALAPPAADLIDVGKRPGGSHTQDLINDLLVHHAQSGRRVVRLKGGDPFIFGRGGEEVEALARHGIACEVVPGVSSAFAAAAMVGIPVTHRGVARAVTVVTGHEAAHSEAVDWSCLAGLGGTLVVLMGVERRGAIAARLIAGGMQLDTPTAVVMHAATSQQRAWTGRLDELATADVESPAVIVVGAVAAFPAALDALLHAGSISAS